MSKVKLIIDTDPGVDDAMAIFFALLHPDIEVVGMTSIFGNVTVPIATRNALALGDLAGVPVPVAEGSATPLVQPPNPVSDYVHGEEGFGDIPPQTSERSADPRSAAQFICDEINKAPGEIILCPIGPLTNIARAIVHDPSIVDKVKSVILMGGSYERGGNVTPHAEANIWNDPHAADIVFAADWSVAMVGLDVTQQVVCTKEDFAELADAAPKLGGFLKQAADYYIKFYEHNVGIEGCYLHDPAAVIAALRPELFAVENQAIEVIVEGTQVGRTKAFTEPGRPDVNICLGIDAADVKQLFMDTIKSGF